MRRILTSMVLFSAAFAGVAVADDAEKAMKDLEGRYDLKTLMKNGKPAPDKVIADFKEMVIKGDTITIKQKERDEVAKFKLDPGQKPAHIDITPVSPASKKRTQKGIYKFENGTLTIVLAREGERPKDFEANEIGLGKMVFQKKKEKEKE